MKRLLLIFAVSFVFSAASLIQPRPVAAGPGCQPCLDNAGAYLQYCLANGGSSEVCGMAWGIMVDDCFATGQCEHQ